MKWRAAAGAALLAVAASGCAGRWENPALPRERWAEDERACALEADLEVERLTRGERLASGDATLGRGAYEQGMARLEVRRLQRSAVERCMTARGYALVRSLER